MTGQSARGGFPGGGGGLRTEEYVDFLAKEYLGDYLRLGGAAVRFAVVAADEVAERLSAGLAAAAAADGYTYAAVDAATSRVHLIDQLFAAVSRQVDWRRLAADTVRSAYAAIGLPVPSDISLVVAEVARHHDVDARELGRSLRRQLEQAVLADAGLAPEFRLAVLRLCQAELRTGEVDASERDAVLSWLRVEPVPLQQLRPSLIYGRVARHNARPLLISLAAWLARTTGAGLVLDLDLTRLAVSRRPPLDERDGFYYSKAATLDAYEVVRQLLDATDQLRSTLVVATIPPELVTDESRGLPAYAALQLRVVDEVRDRRRANPYAALVRLEVRLEAVR